MGLGDRDDASEGTVMGRPPAYLSRATLATELDCAESTVDEMVKRGVLPAPRRLSPGCVRWKWMEVEAALDSYAQRRENAAEGGGTDDPYAAGVRNVSKIAEGGRRAS